MMPFLKALHPGLSEELIKEFCPVMMKNVACICLCLLLLGTSSSGQQPTNESDEDNEAEPVDEFEEQTGCTRMEFTLRSQELGSYMFRNCRLYYVFMRKFNEYPIITDAGMPKQRICRTPPHIADWAQTYIGSLTCLKEDYKMVLYMKYNITLKVAEVYCENYDEIHTAKQQGLLSCSNVTREDLKHHINFCVDEAQRVYSQVGFCNATSTILTCIHEIAFGDCSDSLKVHAKEFLQKVMDKLEMCPHVEI